VLVQEGHEVVNPRDKLLLDSVRPVVLGQKSLDIVGVHLLEKIVEGLLVDSQEGDLIAQGVETDVVSVMPLDEADYVIVLSLDILSVEFWRSRV
jgi:hypothetical protein